MAQYFLRTKRSEGVANLYTKVRRNSMQLYICTPIKVDVKEWNKAQKSKAALTKYLQTDEGKKVQDLQTKCNQVMNDLYVNHQINSLDDKPMVEQALSSIVMTESTKKVAEDAADGLTHVKAFYDYFFKGISDGTIRHGNNAAYSQGSIVVWKGFGRFLNAYVKDDISFNDIDKPFADKFTVFLEKKGLMANTINKHVTCFRKLCNLAAEEGYNENAVSLKVWKEHTVGDDSKRAEIYLTDEELDALYAMPLEGFEDKVRDVFMLGYMSCQRFSDYSKLSRDNFITLDSGMGAISLIQKKTGKKVNVPIVDERVYEICEKYDYDFPEITDHQLNTMIKVILKRLSATVPSLAETYVTNLTVRELNAEKTYRRLLRKKKAGKKWTDSERKNMIKLQRIADEATTPLEEGKLWEYNSAGQPIRPKYALVSSHTSRRSGATNLYKLGVLNNKEMRSITGHQSEKVFESYIRVGLSEQADLVGAKLKEAMAKKRKMAE